jgi:hypothetical protein
LQLAEQLRSFNIECEYADAQSLVLLFSPVDGVEVFDRLTQALDSVHLDTLDIPNRVLRLPALKQALTMRDAVFSTTETIPISSAVGRVCAEVRVPCPPAIPIVVSGEVVTHECIEIFKNYGLNLINVVK